jgi:hypothetical protein
MRIFRGKLWAIEERGALTFTSTARIRLRVPTSRRRGQDELGTWSIEKRILDDLILAASARRGHFRDLGNVHSLVLSSDDGGRDLWDQFPIK